MLLKCMAKLFAFQPKANAIEAGVIVALILTALLSILLAVSDPLAAFYDSVVGESVVGIR
jgi:hypothetical protein